MNVYKLATLITLMSIGTEAIASHVPTLTINNRDRHESVQTGGPQGQRTGGLGLPGMKRQPSGAIARPGMLAAQKADTDVVKIDAFEKDVNKNWAKVKGSAEISDMVTNGFATTTNDVFKPTEKCKTSAKECLEKLAKVRLVISRG
jgi:hypothetical protein